MTANRWTLFAATALTLALGLAADLAAADEPNKELIQMIVELLADPDKDVRALALEQVRSNAPGEASTKRFAAELPKLAPEAQVGLIGALADRQDIAARPAVLEALDAAREEPVRIAAINALGALGQPTDAPLLVRSLDEGSSAETKAAKASLVRLPGEEAPEAIVAAMNNASSPALRVALIEILAARRAVNAVPDLLKAAVDDDASVRSAAMAALGQLAASEHGAGMVQGVLKAEKGPERQAAEKALASVYGRIADSEKRADALLAAIADLDKADQIALLPALGRVGGQPALKAIETAIAAPDPQAHAAAVRALCNWPDASIAPRLIDAVHSDEHPEHQTLALRALVRVAALPDGRSDEQRLQLLQQAMAMCTRDEERRLALERAHAIRTLESLRFIMPYLEQPALAQQACESVVELAHHRGLREPNKAEFDRALDQVLSISNDPIVRERAQRYKKGQTWARPVAS